MAVDRKYGRVTFEKEPGTPIPDDEPVFIFRAQDKLLPALLEDYWWYCKDVGSPEAHLDAIRDMKVEVEKWQETHPTKVPD